jgi:hypothetical protein
VLDTVFAWQAIEEAQAHGSGAIIFIDEIDVITVRRQGLLVVAFLDSVQPLILL